MKRRVYLFITLCLISLQGVMAQLGDVRDSSICRHLDFQGVSMGISIEDFAEQLKPRFTVRRKMGGERQWILQGYIFGYDTYFQVDYSKKSRSVFRITAMPKNIHDVVWIDSLTTHYGSPLTTDMGLLWQRPEGTVLFRVLEGYDPALILLDKAGQAAWKEEK